jgi:hypothetical protein
MQPADKKNAEPVCDRSVEESHVAQTESLEVLKSGKWRLVN